MPPHDQVILIIVLWVSFAAGVGALYRSRGGSFIMAFLASILFSPLIAFLAVVVSPKNEKALELRSLRSGQAKKCPKCAETVKAGASVCRFCGFNFRSSSSSSQPSSESASEYDHRPPSRPSSPDGAALPGQEVGFHEPTKGDHYEDSRTPKHRPFNQANETEEEFFNALGLGSNAKDKGEAPTTSRKNEDSPRISVVCHCGAQLNAKPRLAGKAVKCPQCNAVIQIPGAQS